MKVCAILRSHIWALWLTCAVIGEGAYSTVYRGTWNGEEVAIKVLIEGLSEQVRGWSNAYVLSSSSQILLREASCWARLDHPRVHRFLRACPNPPFLVSQFHRNGDALNYLKNNPKADRLSIVGLP